VEPKWAPEPEPAPQPIPGPPPGPPPTPPEGKSRKGLVIALTIVAVLVMIGVTIAAIVMSNDDPAEPSANKILLVPANATGNDPFTANLAKDYDEDEVRGLTPVDHAAGGEGDLGKTLELTGTQPGLYGGTLDESSCDRKAMIGSLDGDDAKRSAWASVQGIPPSDLTAYLEGLTPAVLLADTRVTNHGYSGGEATPYQAVLQAGTAVLVDDRGVPRARCAGGNPLTPPLDQGTDFAFSGSEWSGFDADRLVTIRPGEPTDVFVLVDIPTGRPFSRPAGSTGADDQPITGTTTTTASTTTSTSTTSTSTSTTTTSTSTTSTTVAAAPTDVTDDGVVSASSTFSPNFPADLAVDGDPATSWFSQGVSADPNGSTFTWRTPDPELIQEITIVGNGRSPEFAENFGFESVRVEVLVGDDVAYTESFGLPGTPDPTVNARPRVVGDGVRLTFTGFENPDQGGFAELKIVALR
jgi:hypothetical protein